MHHILIPVEAGHDGRTQSAVAQAAQLHHSEASIVHLLRVQPQVSGHVAAYFDPREMHELQIEWADEALQPAKMLLERAGVPFDCTVKVGQSAKTIAQTARDLGCDRVIFGEQPVGLAERLFGSLAQQVRHLLHSQGDPVVIGS